MLLILQQRLLEQQLQHLTALDRSVEGKNVSTWARPHLQ